MKISEPIGNGRLVATLALAMGVMSFDQGSVGYMLPFIKPDLGLSNVEVGVIASIYWVTFAIASYAVGILATRRSAVQHFLVGALALFGLCGCATAWVGGSGELLFARAAMGLLAGALLTLGQSVLGLVSRPDKLSTNMGLVTGFGGSLAGLVAAPVAFVQIASSFGWRTGYFAIALPAWLAAILVSRIGTGPDAGASAPSLSPSQGRSLLASIRVMMSHRNIPLCAVLCSLYVAYLGLGFTFIPIFLVSARGFSPAQMSWMIVVLGLSSILFSIALPAISNRVGRKPVLLVASAASLLTPLAACFYTGPTLILGLLFFLGWPMTGLGTFSMGIIPAESVRSDALTRALGLVIATGVLVGGLAGPAIAGWGADHWGPRAPLFVQAACAALSAAMALGLAETAPRRGSARLHAPGAATVIASPSS